MSALQGSWEDSINLSRATKLEEAVFRAISRDVRWVTGGLRTITPAHKDLREVSLIIPSLATDRGFDEDAHTQRAGLDRVLVQLCQPHRKFVAGDNKGKGDWISG